MALSLVTEPAKALPAVEHGLIARIHHAPRAHAVHFPATSGAAKGAEGHLALLLLEDIGDIGGLDDGDVFHHEKDLRLVEFLEHLGQLGAEPAERHLIRHHPRARHEVFPLAAVRVAAGGKFHHVVERELGLVQVFQRILHIHLHLPHVADDLEPLQVVNLMDVCRKEGKAQRLDLRQLERHDLALERLELERVPDL